jgi:hypothetical protein
MEEPESTTRSGRRRVPKIGETNGSNVQESNSKPESGQDIEQEKAEAPEKPRRSRKNKSPKDSPTAKDMEAPHFEREINQERVISQNQRDKVKIEIPVSAPTKVPPLPSSYFLVLITGQIESCQVGKKAASTH